MSRFRSSLAMKSTPLLFSLFCLQRAIAGPDPVTPPPQEEHWLTPSLQIRGRYEHASVDAPGIESADAVTFRERIGLVAKSDFGFSAFIEGEFTQVLVDRYDAAAGAETYPENPTRTQINDPENVELNQGWILYSATHMDVKLGRQRVILDNASIVGNSGWRQNEQTYDGILFQNTSADDLNVFYSYVNRVNRIFGSEASGIQNHFSGDVHLLNARYSGIRDFVATGYVYLMDFRDGAQAFSNDTLGLSVKKTFGPFMEWKPILFGEAAWQSDGGNGPVDYQAWYGHVMLSVERGNHTAILGYEQLGAGDGTSFKTPLATAHAFNGFSDTLVGARLGGTEGGIGDLYVTYDVKLPWKINGQVVCHWLGQDNLGGQYGKELDIVLSKKFEPGLQAILKWAAYDASGPVSGSIPNPAPFDATRISVEMNYVF